VWQRFAEFGDGVGVAHDPGGDHGDDPGGDHDVFDDADDDVEDVEHDDDDDEQAMEPNYLGSEAKGFEQLPKLASNLEWDFGVA